MKNTKANVVLVLKAESDNIYYLAQNELKKNGLTKKYESLMLEYQTTMHAVYLLTDQIFFHQVATIYKRAKAQLKEVK